MKANEAAALPPEDRPEWYRPPGGEGNGSDRAPAFSERNIHQLAAGHRSPRVYSQVAAVLVAGLIETRPDLASFPESLASWADAEARAALLRKYLDENGLIDPIGSPRESLLMQLDRFERRANTARVQLGLDPRSEAELALLRAKAMREGTLTPTVSLDVLAQQGRAVLASVADPVRDALERVRDEVKHAAPSDTSTTKPPKDSHQKTDQNQADFTNEEKKE